MAPTSKHARRAANTELQHARESFRRAITNGSSWALLDALTRAESLVVNR